MKKMALIVSVCIGLMSSTAFAAKVPSAAECKAARAKLAELTSDDYKALKAKTKTNEQVGDALAQYADNEESVSGKFALLQDAFQQYVLGKSVDKAESVYSKAQSIGGVEYALEMARRSRSKLSAYATSKNAPAKALNERIMADEKSFQRVGIVKAKLKKSPGDESLSEQLGIESAAIGDWESALPAFQTAAGEVAKVAGWELNGGKGVDYTAATVGAFWWKFADNFPQRKNVEEAMKLHAAMWYKLALDKDAFKGNEKTIIEKRIAETDKFGAAEQAERELAAKKIATLDPIMLEFSKDNVVELIGCPAGEFMMGREGDAGKTSNQMYHKVKITRPFWMSKYKITLKNWSAYQKHVITDRDKILGGWDRIKDAHVHEVDGYFQWLSEKRDARGRKFHIPKGYVFRLPTEAEWEYALNANATDENDLYVQYRKGKLKNPVPLLVTWDEVRARDKENIFRDSRAVWSFLSGTKKPNAWGFHDMLGSGKELTLDTIDLNKKDPVVYNVEEVDPLRFYGGETRHWIFRNRGYWGYYWDHSWVNKDFASQDKLIVFHIVLGPDLMKEKGYTAKAQKR